MKTRKSSKALALFLVMLLMFSSVSMLAGAAGSFTAAEDFYLISDTEYKIAPGITENRIVTNKTNGNQQEMVYAVSVDVSEGSTTGFMASYADYNGDTWKMQSVRMQAQAAAEKTGRNIVAAFNGDAYNMQTGEPDGVLLMGGKLYRSGLGKPYFGITKDGKPVMGGALTQAVLDTLQEAIGGFYMLLENGVRTPIARERDSYVAPHTAIGQRADGSIVVIAIDGRNYPVSNSCDNYDLTTIMIGLGCVNALNFDGGGSTTYLAKYEGSNALTLANRPSDAVERKVSSALLIYSTAKPSGEFDHASLSPVNTLYTPNSEVAFSALGVDSAGENAPLPADGAFALADDSFGTITPDGQFTSSGKTGVVTVNYVSAGAVVGTTSIEIATPDELYIPSEEFSLDFDETTDFGLVAKNKDRTINIKDGDVVWSAVDANGKDVTETAGTFSGLTFKTRSNDSLEAIVTVASAYDASVTASTKAVIGAAPVMLYDFEYTDDAEEAANSGGRLKYIPSLTLPTFDKSGPLSNVQFAAKCYDEGYPLYSWPNASLGPTAIKSTIVSDADGEPVRFGDHSLRMDVDFSSFNMSSNSNNYLRTTMPDYFFDGAPKKIGAWVYVPEGMANFCLYLNCCNKEQNLTYAPVSNTNGTDYCENWVGWKYVEMELTDTTIPASNGLGAANYPFGFYQGCGVFWVSYQPGKNFGSRSASTVYIDNIQLIYSSNTDDTKNPEVSSITYDTAGAPEEFVNNETVLTDNTVTIRASYHDAEDKYMTGINPDAVYMSIDGVDVTDKCFINEGDEQIYFYDAQLNNGTHSVSVTVYDNFGNKTTETRYFTVTGSKDATVALVAEQANPVLGMDYTLDVKAEDAADISGAEIAVHTFAGFTYYYDNVTVVPAEGYALDGAASYDSTNAVISFKLKKDGASVPADGVIARIVYAIPSNVRSDSIDVSFRVDQGQVLYATAKNEKDLGSFGGTVYGSCIAPLVVSSDTFLVGSSGSFTVVDLDGNPVSGAKIVYSDGTPVSDALTDANGKLSTDAFADAVKSFTVRAEKDGLISFYYTSQSFASGGDEDGKPTSIALNGAKDGSSMINVSWYASPYASAAKAIAKYATKADYEANGDAAWKEATGNSRLEELASSGNINTNMAIRFNKVVISGLQPQTEYVYMVGDGEKMSELKTFKTGRFNIDTNFFIIGDMQDEDTSNLDSILDALDTSETSYDFGLQTGDAVDNGGMYKWWVNVASIFSSGYLSTRPIIHVLGNHEYYGDLTGENAADYFGMTTQADGSAPLAYSTTYGNVYVAVINYTDKPANYESAIEWVKEDARATTALWKVLAIHQPAYYTNVGGSNGIVNTLIPPLVDEIGFDFVFSGHDHSYVRTYPVTGGERDDDNGAVYYICGSTGEKSYAVVEVDGFPYEFVRGRAALEGEYNAIYMTAQTTDTTFTVNTHEVTTATDGTYTDKVIDSYTMTKTIDCTAAGEHDYVYGADGYLTCAKCGYAKKLDSAYTGFATDAATGKTRYFINGVGQTGWLTHGEDVYYFTEDGLTVSAGKRTINGIDYTFDSEGKQTTAVFVRENGYTRAYWGGSYMTSWNEIDGKTYFFSTSADHPGKMLTGKVTILIYTGQRITYRFAQDGHLLDYVFVEEEGGTRYYWAQTPQTGWVTIDGKQYYFDPATAFMATDEAEIDGVTYAFSSKGVLLHEGAHDYGEGVHKDAVCTKAETTTYTCSICGNKKVIEGAPALGAHIDENGNKLCDVCGMYTGSVPSILEPVFRFVYTIIDMIRNLFK